MPQASSSKPSTSNSFEALARQKDRNSKILASTDKKATKHKISTHLDVKSL